MAAVKRNSGDPIKFALSAKAVENLNETLHRDQAGIAASYGLVGAVLVCGGAGYAIDRLAGTTSWGTVTGLLLGLGLGLYNVLRNAGRR